MTKVILWNTESGSQSFAASQSMYECERELFWVWGFGRIIKNSPVSAIQAQKFEAWGPFKGNGLWW